MNSGNSLVILQRNKNPALEKQLLVWWMREKTVVSRRWICEKLGVRDLSRVTNAMRKGNLEKENEIRKWKKQLEVNS